MSKAIRISSSQNGAQISRRKKVIVGRLEGNCTKLLSLLMEAKFEDEETDRKNIVFWFRLPSGEFTDHLRFAKQVEIQRTNSWLMTQTVCITLSTLIDLVDAGCSLKYDAFILLWGLQPLLALVP